MLKKTKSLVSVVLALALMLSSFVLTGISAGAVTASEPSQSNGVYLVSTLDELMWASENPQNNYVLTADLDNSQADIMLGTVDSPFSGTFNGAGHTVTIDIDDTTTSADNVYYGLFGCVSGTVSGLTVAGSIDVNIVKGSIGGVAATLLAGTISNCTSNVAITVTATSVSHLGGIAGAALYGAPSTITDSVNNGKLSTMTTNTSSTTDELGNGAKSGTTAGILGFICDTTGANITRCINNGAITVNGGQENIGGIVGQTSSNSDTSYVNITYCANKGTITGTNIAGERASGIIGYIKGGKINYCYNTADIIEKKSDGSSMDCYGMFGYMNFLSSKQTFEMTYCYNASPKALKAELSYMKGTTSYGTFGTNFYLSGRTAYNTTDGTTGTAFTDAADLLAKITSTEAGAAAYVANPNGGYPLLSYEVSTQLTTDNYSGTIYTENAGSLRHNLYSVLVVNDSANTSGLSASAELVGDSAVLGTGTLTETDSIKINGVTYTAAAGCKLYTYVYNSLSDDIWATLTLTASVSGTQVVTASVDSATLFAGSGVDIPFEGMPNYPEGTISSTYNAGPGLANDKLSTTDTDTQMVIISSTSGSTLAAYVTRLINKGFTEISTRTVDDNTYYSMEYNGQYYYLYYTDYSSQVRIVQDNSSTILPTEIDTDALGSGTTELYQYSIDYTEGEGQTSHMDYWKIDCGMMYVIKFADNSVMIVDGGHERQSSNYAMEKFNDFLYEITGTPKGEQIKIKTWFFSHAHGDHVYFAYDFLEHYHNNYNLQSMMYNIPSYQTMSNGYDSGTFLMKDTVNAYYPNCDFVKLQTGETFDIQGVNFDVWFTHEDATNANGTTKISDFNATSTVMKVTIDGQSLALLGDISSVAEQEILHMYDSDTLVCDAVQAAHHGYNDVSSLYNAIQANLALIPNSEANAGAASGNAAKFAALMNAGTDTVALFAGDYTYKITVADGAFVYEKLPSYRAGINYFTIPDLDESLTQGATESTVDLNTVLAKKSLLDQIIDKSATQTVEAASTSEDSARMFDGSTATKFCTKNIPAAVGWNMKGQVTVTSYVMYTANDNAENVGRNPKNWVLCGSNDGENWTVLDAVADGNLPDSDYTGTAFNIDNPGAYQYYVIKFFSTDGADVLQLSEIALYADPNSDDLAAQNVMDMIAALGTVTSLDSKAAVEAARAAYNTLNDTQKALVINYSDLQDAETAVANLQAVADVIAQIAALGTVTSLDSKTAVEAARAAYNTLTDTQKTGVTNYSALTTAEDTIAELENGGTVKRGDVDGDGNITVSDVVELRGVIMAGSPTANQLTAGDLDGSGALTVSDVVDLRDYIMKGIFD